LNRPSPDLEFQDTLRAFKAKVLTQPNRLISKPISAVILIDAVTSSGGDTHDEQDVSESSCVDLSTDDTSSLQRAPDFFVVRSGPISF
jgi:hypothetical protein